ncbi:type III PLP-dependent enzyme [Micromonospora sp. NBC_01699]|uniref:type III PLP-dependent enzyme n=1 Tax=Micromonospora sp. NBC_01699 TaxID=2975984 RepID=UPI002E28EBF8|nr:type III PLP-dependent enzyme [Micromonospora sp. NBC_01699]
MTRHAALAARYGTPLYVYDLDEVALARHELFTALPDGAELFYAFKANPHPELARALREGGERGCRAEISSTGELAAALTAGYRAEECLYTGPGKTIGELHEAIGRGVRVFSTDSVTDVRRVGAVAAAHGVVADCLLRINSADASATTSIRMTGTPSQFGFDSETLAEAMPSLRRADGVRLAGMHLFPLSNARDEDALIGEFEHTIELAARLSAALELPLRLLDIGGGFTAPYGVPGRRGSYPNLRDRLETALDRHLPGWRSGAPRIAFESGRFLVGAAGTLVTEVSNVKISRGRRYVIVDAGINTFGGMSGLGRLMPVAVALELEPDGPTERGTLVGPLCTPGDLLGREIALPADLEPGDLVEIPNTGAYGVTASLLMFLGRPAPLEVLLRSGEVVSASRIEHHRSHQPVPYARTVVEAGALG